MRRVLVMGLAAVLPSLFPSYARAESARPSVLGMALPARGPDAEALGSRVAQLGDRLAARLSLPSVRSGELNPQLDLSARFAEARALAVKGSLDEAAVILDVALEEGARQVHRLAHRAEWVRGAIGRVSIALARGEKKRASELLRRVLLYDPGVELEAGESSPQLRAALGEARRELGASPLSAEVLADACHEFAVVVTARLVAPTGTLELSRFDDCKLVARATASGGATDRFGDAELIAALATPALSPATATAARAGPAPIRPAPVGKRSRPRALRIAGITTGAAGLALLGIGTYFGADAASRAKDIAHDCGGASAPCMGEVLAARNRALETSKIAASVLWATGAAALVAGVVVYAVGVKHPRAQALLWPTANGLACAF